MACAAALIAGASSIAPAMAGAQSAWRDTHCYYDDAPGRALTFPLPAGHTLALRRSGDPDALDGQECTAEVRDAGGSLVWVAAGFGAGFDPWTGNDVDGDGRADAVVRVDAGGGNRCCWIAWVLRIGEDSVRADSVGLATWFQADDGGRTLLWELVPFYDLAPFSAAAPVVRLARQYRAGRLVDVTLERCPGILSGEERGFGSSRDDRELATPEARAAARNGSDTAWTVVRTRSAVSSLALQHLACGAPDAARALVEDTWPAPAAEERWRSLLTAWGRVASPDCLPSEAAVAWMQDLLDGWSVASRDYLRQDPEPLPWMILFDGACVWHLGELAEPPESARRIDLPLSLSGHPVAAWAEPHGGTVALPNGARIPADIVAVAFPLTAAKAFFVMAMPSLWRAHPRASRDPHLEIRIRSVPLHEMLHTRQLPVLRRRVSELGESHDLPAQFDDDVIETRFRDAPGYREAFERERDLLYEAVAAAEPTARDSLLGEALSAAARRQERYFVGDDAVYGELEGLFLNMEGVAEWIRFRYHRDYLKQPEGDAQVLAFLRGSENSWSQDEGLALVLLLDEVVPDWRDRLLGEEMASPWTVLREHLTR